MPRVLNKRTDRIPLDAVYVGRPSKWGNPFKIGGGSQLTRGHVIELYKLYLLVHTELVEAVRKELRGKDLVCWCAPLLCHADILLELANA